MLPVSDINVGSLTGIPMCSCRHTETKSLSNSYVHYFCCPLAPRTRQRARTMRRTRSGAGGDIVVSVSVPCRTLVVVALISCSLRHHLAGGRTCCCRLCRVHSNRCHRPCCRGGGSLAMAMFVRAGLVVGVVLSFGHAGFPILVAHLLGCQLSWSSSVPLILVSFTPGNGYLLGGNIRHDRIMP